MINMNDSQSSKKDPQSRIQALEAELTHVQQKLAGREVELEAHEALLKMSLDDMRRIFEDLIRSQGQLLQADKMATMGILAAGVAHEINNPLAAVKLVIALAKSHMQTLKKLSENLSDEAKAKTGQVLKECEEHLAQGDECVDHITQIVRDMKVFSRSDRGDFHPDNLNRILDSVVAIVWNSIKTKIELKKNYGELPMVPCNPQQMSQVFLNLIVNASQAMERGIITLVTRVEKDYAVIEISDNGSGIPPEILDKIFDPFFTTKDAEKGTGLGLSITQDIVKRHKGTISVRSQVGQGTMFMIQLPVH